MNGDNDGAPFGFHELIVGENATILVSVVGEPRHPESQKLIAYWHECAARGGLRVGRDLPAAAVARLMSKLIVFEPSPADRDFRIRLAGTGLLRRFGRDVSGQMLSDVYGGKSFQSYADNLQATLLTGKPIIVDSKIVEGPNELFHIEYVFLPAISYDGNHNWIVTGAFYFG